MATGIGEALRIARRRRGRSLADAAAETRVRESYLAALEEEDFAALGGGVYVKGFIRSYAKFLGVDPEPLLDAYRAAYEQDDSPTVAAPAPVAPMARRERPSGPAAIVVVAGVLLLVLAGIGMLVGGDGDAPDVALDRGPAPVEPTETDAPDAEATPSPSPSPTPTVEAPPPEIDGIEVVVRVTGEVSWMRVQVDGETVLEGERNRGFSETFTAQEVVLLRVGDASAVSVEANGQDQGEIGSANEVVVLTCTEGRTQCDVEVVA